LNYDDVIKVNFFSFFEVESMSIEPLRILQVEDNPYDAELALRELAALPFKLVPLRVETEAAYRKALVEFAPHLVLADFSLPAFTGMDALAILREKNPDTPLIIVTGSLNEETAVACMKMGASDYVLKEHLFKLHPAVNGVLEKARILDEKKSTEDRLKESLQNLQAVVNTSPLAITALDLTGKVFLWNPAAERIYGWTEAETLGRVLPTLPEGDTETYLHFLADFAREGGTRTWTGRRRKKSGEFIQAKIHAALLHREASGEPYGIMAVIEDETERIAAEAALKSSREELSRSLEQIRRSWEQTIAVMAGLVELRDPYTAGHQRGVALLATSIARKMKLGEDRARGVYLAATIHDVGKINVPAEILSKPGRLSDLEVNLVRTHPQAGWEALKDIDVPWPLAEIVCQHHERLDGSGYPKGLMGTEILLEARIIAVADVVEAMSNHRPYRAAFGVESALEEIRSGSGRLYDPDVAMACCEVFEEEGFSF
jgi:PAS domain S-box-containing protein